MITVRVPATSANLGAGFDSLGIALSLYNTVSFEEWDGMDITSCDGTYVPKDESNLVYSTAKKVYRLAGKPFRGLRLVQANALPMARGLGSSSACIVAGIMGANRLLDFPLTNAEMLDFAVKLEGHPDNVAPALLGGFVSCVVEGGHAYVVKKDVDKELIFAAFIPSFRLLTEKARAVLPDAVTMKKATNNISRAALCACAFCEQRYDLLGVATKDSLHQPYRLPLIEGGREILQMCTDNGALCSFVSGAGPTLMACLNQNYDDFYLKAQKHLKEMETGESFTITKLYADNEGAKII